LDEALGFAAGLGRIRLGADMLEPEMLAIAFSKISVEA
jgi:hypothetical protein